MSHSNGHTESPDSASPQRIRWDFGTAYDFFASLNVLHNPDIVGLRAAWAAGVRSRFPAEERDTLETGAITIDMPARWIFELPASKDAATVLERLAAIPPEKRLKTLLQVKPGESEVMDVLLEIGERGQWNEDDLRFIQQFFKHKPKSHKPSKEQIIRIMDCWAEYEAFGEPYLTALRSYYDNFFAEEERRIRPALETALAEAQERAAALPLPELLEELSRGVRFATPPDEPELVLVPSFWFSPLIVSMRLSEQQHLLMFAGRPLNVSLVPGEPVPDGLVSALKALADPTRLRILRYLTTESLTPSELAQRLRLRPPTVVHHLRTLRLAGLVQTTLETWDRVRYKARPEAITQAFAGLDEFLHQDKAIDETSAESEDARSVSTPRNW